MKNLQFMLALIIISLVLTRPVFAEPHNHAYINPKIWDSLLVPSHGIEIYGPYVTTNGSVAFLHFHVYGTCSGACGVNCPFETYTGFLECSIYGGSGAPEFWPVFQFDGNEVKLLNPPNSTCNCSPNTLGCSCPAILVNWTGREWKLYVENPDSGNPNYILSVYGYDLGKGCLRSEKEITESYRFLLFRLRNLESGKQSSGVPEANGTLSGGYLVFKFNGNSIKVPVGELRPYLQYEEMLKHMRAVPFKGGYLLFLNQYMALDASGLRYGFNYMGWAVFPNDCDVLKSTNKTQWAECVGKHLIRRDELKPYPLFYYKNGTLRVFYPFESPASVLKPCNSTTSSRGVGLWYLLGGILVILLALIGMRKR